MTIARYKWPVVIAASLHGALFLAFPVDPVTAAPRPAEAPPLPPIPPVPSVDEIEVTESGGGDAGEPVAALPRQPERPLLDPPDAAFKTAPVERAAPLKPVPDLNGRLSAGGGLGEGGWNMGAPRIWHTGELDRPPRAMAQTPPDYPYALRSAGVSGSVTVEFLVGTDGHVLSAEAVRWTHREFRDPAVRAVYRWRFEPGTVDGRKVRFRMAVPIEFTADR